LSFLLTEAGFFVLLHVLVELAVIMRILLRPHRQPASRIAWIVVVLALPVFGILDYILFGEVNIGRSRVKRLRHVLEQM
jgi:cardiolipin synthase